jgi:hypothetical protein
MRPFLWLNFLIVVLLPCALDAQQPEQPAPINVEISDQSGARVPLARVMVDPPPNPAATMLMTNQDGKLSLSLTPGHYSLTAEKFGFKPARKELEATAGGHQTISMTLMLGGCSPCVAVQGVPALVFPDQMMGSSPDGRYLLHQKGRSGRHVIEIEDRVLKTRRILVQYHQRVIMSWLGSHILATDYFDDHASESTLYSTDKKTPPISLWDLLNSQLKEDEKRGLEEVLRNKRVEVVGYEGQWGGIDVKVTAYGATGALEFEWYHHLALPREGSEPH